MVLNSWLALTIVINQIEKEHVHPFANLIAQQILMYQIVKAAMLLGIVSTMYPYQIVYTPKEPVALVNYILKAMIVVNADLVCILNLISMDSYY